MSKCCICGGADARASCEACDLKGAYVAAQDAEHATVERIVAWLRRQKPTVELEPAGPRSMLPHPVSLDATRFYEMAAECIERGDWKEKP